MTGKTKFVGLVFLVCVLLAGGCGMVGGRKAKEQKVEKTEAEKKKEALLSQLDTKFEDPESHFELGKLYQADGLWTQAEREYSIALSFDPVHREAQAGRVKVLTDSGDANKANLLADIYMNQASNSASASLRLALAFQSQGLDEYALGCYRQALHLAPNSAKINRQIGYYYLSKNDKEQARAYLSRSFQIDSLQPEVAGELGRLGVVISVPRKTEKDTKKLDEMVEKSNKKKSK